MLRKGIAGGETRVASHPYMAFEVRTIAVKDALVPALSITILPVLA